MSVIEQMNKGERTLKIIKRVDRPLSLQGERSELRLLCELIERNPERAREFLRRLGESVKAVA